MELTEKNLDKSLELALENLRKNLEESGGNSAGTTIGRAEVLLKAREAVRSGKLDLTTAGIVEGRINKNIPLSKAHRAILGLSPGDIIQGLEGPKQSAPAVRMGGKAPGGSVAKIDTGAVAPGRNSIIEAMAAGQRMTHNFQSIDGTVNVVSGAEILRKCQALVKKGMLTLTRAADVERLINSGLPVRPEILRGIFEI